MPRLWRAVLLLAQRVNSLHQRRPPRAPIDAAGCIVAGAAGTCRPGPRFDRAEFRGTRASALVMDVGAADAATVYDALIQVAGHKE